MIIRRNPVYFYSVLPQYLKLVTVNLFRIIDTVSKMWYSIVRTPFHGGCNIFLSQENIKYFILIIYMEMVLWILIIYWSFRNTSSRLSKFSQCSAQFVREISKIKLNITAYMCIKSPFQYIINKNSHMRSHSRPQKNTFHVMTSFFIYLDYLLLLLFLNWLFAEY